MGKSLIVEAEKAEAKNSGFRDCGSEAMGALILTHRGASSKSAYRIIGFKSGETHDAKASVALASTAKTATMNAGAVPGVHQFRSSCSRLAVANARCADSRLADSWSATARRCSHNSLRISVISREKPAALAGGSRNQRRGFPLAGETETGDDGIRPELPNAQPWQRHGWRR